MSASQAIRPGRKLRIARVIAELKQEDLAAQAGVHQTFISLLERGKCGTTLETLEALAAACGCDIAELMPDAA